MKQISDPLVQSLQRGVAEILRFVQLVWTWSSEQIIKVTQAPWENWPLWKQILLVIVVAAVVYFLFIAALQLWTAAINLVAAFATLIGTVLVTLPTILIAGVVALAGLWVINNFHNLSSLRSLITFQGSNTGPSNDSGNAQPGQTPIHGPDETTGSR
jgi:hypothetical protein